MQVVQGVTGGTKLPEGDIADDEAPRPIAGGARSYRWFGLVLVLRQGAYHIETARNELIKLPVFEIKCKAMMGICIYWISRHVIFGKRCKTVP